MARKAYRVASTNGVPASTPIPRLVACALLTLSRTLSLSNSIRVKLAGRGARREHIVLSRVGRFATESCNEVEAYFPNRACQTHKFHRVRGFIRCPNNLQISAIAVAAHQLLAEVVKRCADLVRVAGEAVRRFFQKLLKAILLEE